MKAKKLKKSLSAVFLSQIYFKSPLFVIGEQKNSKIVNSYTFLKFLTVFFLNLKKLSLKYPLYIKFFANSLEVQTFLSKDSNFIFINLREFFIKTNYLYFKNSIYFINTFAHLEFFLKKDLMFLTSSLLK